MTRLPLVYTVAEVCEIFTIANSTFWLWAKNGKFRLLRLGGRTYVPVEEIAKIVDGVSK